MPPAETRTTIAFPSLPLISGGSSGRAEGVEGLPVIWRLLRYDGCEPLFCFAKGLASVISVLQRLIDAVDGASLYLASRLRPPCGDDGHNGVSPPDQTLKGP
jgi:hypothetical protein